VLRDVASILIRIPNNGNNIIATPDFVVLEPIVERLDNTRAVFLDVFDCVDERSDRVVNVDDQDLPVGFAAIVGSDTA
jgi:hypothetical protein